MPQPLPPLKGLRAFETAARQGSFTAAAEELAVTPAAVSHQVRRLEDYLGIRLFRRLAGGLELTESGAAILPEVTGAFERLATAADRLRASSANRTVSVSVTPSLASRWLVPRIDRFHERHPGFELRVDARDEAVDLRRDDVDVALRYGPGGYPDCHVERLPVDAVFPVCSPQLLAAGPALEQPADLLHHTLLHVEWRHTTRVAAPDWSWWLEHAGVAVGAPLAGPRFGQHSMAVDAAVAGQGIALANELLAADDLAQGRLARPLPHSVAQEFGYFLVCLPEAAESERVRALRDWVMAELPKPRM